MYKLFLFLSYSLSTSSNVSSESTFSITFSLPGNVKIWQQCFCVDNRLIFPVFLSLLCFICGPSSPFMIYPTKPSTFASYFLTYSASGFPCFLEYFLKQTFSPSVTFQRIVIFCIPVSLCPVIVFSFCSPEYILCCIQSISPGSGITINQARQK